MTRSRRYIIRLIGYTLLALVGYFLSYAPFLLVTRTYGSAYHRGPYYRSPRLFRPVDWCILNTPARPVLLKWSECLGAKGATEFQVWFFAMGVEDPSSEMHFNIVAD